MNINRPIAFVLVSSNHGTMITNRNDYCVSGNHAAFGVGFDVLQTGSYAQNDVNTVLDILKILRSYRGDGLLAVDCGANMGTHTVEWSKLMTGWGKVIAFEPQEYIYYSLAGNIAINNCFNATAHYAAVGRSCGEILIPVLDYLKPANFGGLELKPITNEFLGQQVDYSKAALKPTRLLSIDSLSLPRLDFLKLDVEGMEEEVLAGAQETICAHKPVMLIEIIKSNQNALRNTLSQWGYTHCYPAGLNILAFHKDEPTLKHISVSQPQPNTAVPV